MRKEAIDYLERDPLANIDMLEPIRRDTAEIIAVEKDGVLVFETKAQLYLLTSETSGAAMRLVNRIASANLVAVHQECVVPMLAEKFGLRQTMCCYQATWLHDNPPKVPSSNIVITSLSPNMAEMITTLYSHQIGTEYIRGRILAGEMFGAYDDGALAGFIGLHEEGSIGLLEVIPAFRRKGVGLQLISHLCAHQLSRGRIPFSQFTHENVASRKLHERLGFSISGQLVYWLER